MDVAAYLSRQASRQVPNHIMGAVPHHGLYGAGLHQNSGQQGYSEGAWYTDPKSGLANNFACSRGPLNTWPSSDYSYGFGSNCNILRGNSANVSSFFGDRALGSSEGFLNNNYNMEAGTAFTAFGGTPLLESLGKQYDASQMVVSPEQLSCITSCSDVDMYSDTGFFDVGPTFPGNGSLPVSNLSSESYVQQEHLSQGALNIYGGLLENNRNVYTMGFPSLLGENTGIQFPQMQFLQQDSEMLLEVCDPLSNANFGVPRTSCVNQMEPNIQLSGSQQIHQLHQQSYGQFHEPSEAQSRYNVFEQGEYSTGQDISTGSRLFSEQAKGVELVAKASSSFLSGLIGDAQLVPSRAYEKILLSYIKFQMTHKDGRQVPFIKHMHSVACNSCKCNCDEYFVVVSHFDNCHTKDCKICGPVRKFCDTGKPPSGSVKRDIGQISKSGDRNISSDLSGDSECSSKRQKVGYMVSSATGVSYSGAATISQPCALERFPHFKELPEAPASDNLTVISRSPTFQDSKMSSSSRKSTSCVSNSSRNQLGEIGRPPRLQEWHEPPVSYDLERMGVPTPLQDLKSTSSTGNNVVKNAQGGHTSNTPCALQQFPHFKGLPEAPVSDNLTVISRSPTFQDSKMSSPSRNITSCVSNSSRNQLGEIGRLPHLQECHEPPVSHDLERKGVSTPLQDLKSTSSTGNNVVKNAQGGHTSNTPCALEQFPHFKELPEAPVSDNLTVISRSPTFQDSKMSSPSRNITSCVSNSSRNQLGEIGRLPRLQEWHEPPVSHDLERKGVSTPLQDLKSTSSTRSNVVKNAQEGHTSNTPCKELNGCSGDAERISMCIGGVKEEITDDSHSFNSCRVSLPSNEHLDCHNEERRESTKSDQETQIKGDSPAPIANSEIKTEKPEIAGVSLIDSFTEEEVKEHLCSLRRVNGQGVEPMPYSADDNSCQLCAMNKLPFAPLSVYCSFCGTRMKRNQIYYGAIEEMSSQYCFCTGCFKRFRGDNISCCGISVSKEKFCKKKNRHEDEEAWVQCDKCEGWQHQICALYNDKKDQGGKARYVCPKCYLDGIAAGEITPLAKKDVFEAKDLPTSKLSNHIEQRLRRCLKKEREERAKALHTNIDEVPGASDLVVRVVSSVDKAFEIKPQFSNIFHDENYPSKFPYKSKVILLFQKIEGVDIFLFGFYVQEYGSKCAPPNRRCVYISYLDSVKYFRPEIKTVSGEGLRTFVYHEILIGYLDYCKKRGFSRCYIWTCPPMKGEDFILYCHPETQKTPKPDKLRQWYKTMLRKATEQSIVVDCGNLYDQFFVPTGEPDVKVTAARLPQFDGAYWSGVGVDIINQIEKGCGVGSQSKAKRVPTKRSLKAMGHTNLSADATKDVVLMQKLGQNILPMRENFLVVHLQFSCSRCQEVIQSESRWHCNECKNFQLCARCYDVDKNLGNGSSHTSSRGEKHFLLQVQVDDVPVDTEDNDLIVEKGYLENRHTFLSFCEENHYQFDTLRRAKHSSMMILHQLHNSIMPCCKATCSICHQNISSNRGWSCETCPGFDACDDCYRGKGGEAHIHKLRPRSSIFSCGSKSKQAHTKTRMILDLVKHASKCNPPDSNCSYPNCMAYQNLYRHTSQCSLQINGGCQKCRRFWMMLKVHSLDCGDPNCKVPRCTDMKERARVNELQAEMRRRAAVEES